MNKAQVWFNKKIDRLMQLLRVHRLDILLMLLVGLLFWLPRGFDLDRFTTTDEVVWLWRSGNFYYALGQRDFEATFLNTSPGVTTMWVETAAMLKEFPQYRGFGQGMLDKYLLFEKLLLDHGISPHRILVTSRQITVLLHTLLTMLAFIFARRLFPLLPTLVGFLLLSFDPNNLDLTRLSHLDGPTASFLFLAVLAVLVYTLEGHRFFDLCISAVAAGWAVLSKISGLFVIPFVGLLALVDGFSWSKENLFRNKKTWKYSFGLLLKTAFLWGVVLLLTIGIFFPAMWKNPISNFTGFIFSHPLKIANIADIDTEDDMQSFNRREEGEAATEERSATVSFGFIKTAPKEFWGYLRSVLRGATPITLFGVLATLIAYLFRMHIFTEQKQRRAVAWLIIFALIYTALLSIPTKSSPKYLIPINPVMNLVAGVGWIAVAYWLTGKLHFGAKKYIPALIFVIIVIVQLIPSLQVYPYYATYSSPFVKDFSAWGSGEGLDQAARYLNQKPDAKDLTVLAWYGIGPFSYYFVGNMIPFHLTEEPWGARRIGQLNEIDYIVTYANQWVRDLPNGLNAYLADIEPEQRIWINQREFARIYNVSSFPPQKFESK